MVEDETPPPPVEPVVDEDLSVETAADGDLSPPGSGSLAESDGPTPSAEPPAADRRRVPRGPKSELLDSREPVFRETGGYRLRIEPVDLARLRELPGSKGKTDQELGASFLEGQAARLTEALAGDVETPAEVRVVVDPYSRQAFLAVGRTIRGIVSF
jgi:hypothetical protein